MELTKEQSAAVLDHIRQRWAHKACPFCDAAEWDVADTVYELREFHGGSMVIGPGPLVPIVPVTCTNCGNTVLLNPLVANVALGGGQP